MPTISPIRPAAPPPTPPRDGATLMQDALADIRRRVANGERVVVVFDIDNTLFDSGYRTLEAAHRFGAAQGVPALENLTIGDVRLNAKDTAIAAGVSNIATLRHFSTEWSKFFFNGASYQHDAPLDNSIAWAKAAKKAGAECIYLTGREQTMEAFTRAQLEAAGLPNVSSKSVISKPASATSTPDYKAKEFSKLTLRAHVAWFLTESERDIAAVQKATPKVPCVVLEYPLGENGGHKAAPGTPRLAMDATPH